MSRLFDFNLSTPRNKSEQSTTSECAVVVNNTINSPQEVRPRTSDCTVTYPEPNLFPESPIIMDPVDTRDYKSENQTIIKQLDIYKTVCKCMISILKTTNAKLIANLIDQSDKIIIDGATLIQLISLLTEVPANLIILRCQSESEGCFPKISLITKIEDIKVNNRDFRLQYNEKYNILTEDLGISLVKVFKV
jgi:hypothetical protein